MKTVFIEVDHAVSQESFEKIEALVERETLHNIDFNGYALEAVRGDFTSADIDQVNEKVGHALMRLYSEIRRIADNEDDPS